MSRREPQFFNLSFLDLLSGALGAVIFLFIITPKGGAPPANRQQVAVAFDTIHKQVFGNLADSLLSKKIGDTLFVLLSDYKPMPSMDKCPPCLPCPPQGKPCPPPPKCPECPDNITSSTSRNNTETYVPPTSSSTTNNVSTTTGNNNPKASTQPNNNDYKKSAYRGDPPSVPCKVSFEINWDDIGNNIDLFICKNNKCVSGGQRSIKDIGQWDPGKSKTNIFGSDLRTTQEAVRQFDKILPGEYSIYAIFKESTNNSSTVTVRGLIYTKSDIGKEQGENFTKVLTLNKKDKVLLGNVSLQENGTFTFIQK